MDRTRDEVEDAARADDSESLAKEPALADCQLLAVQGFEPCPRCWSGDEDCDACDGTGILGIH